MQSTDAPTSILQPDHIVPHVQRAIVQDTSGKPHHVLDAPLPTLLPGTVLVKVNSVALNPVDNKMGRRFPTAGAVIGYDYSGTVFALHEDLYENEMAPRTGDRVCGLVHGSNPADPHNGAFAEFVRVPRDMLLHVPTSLTSTQSATLGCALATCSMALWQPDALALIVTPDAPAPIPLPVLVYGGSTSVGTIAIQLLRLSGLEPIATCSPHNADMVRSRGAAAVFDYMTPGVAAQIRLHTGGRLRYALDCIGDDASAACCYDSLGRLGGRYVSLEQISDEARARRRAVVAKFIMALEVFGKDIALEGDYGRPASAEKHTAAIANFRMFERLLHDGKLVPHPTQAVGGRLEDVLGGMHLLNTGSISGKKLVATLE